MSHVDFPHTYSWVKVEVTRNMSIISLIGRDMKNRVGLAAKMFSVLAKANINLEMISQGATVINISCVINSRQSIKAMQIVHDEMLSCDL
jgi:aspartate kinase